jgi:hypothetical protein
MTERPAWALEIEKEFKLPPETQAILDEAVRAYERLEQIRAALDEQGLEVPSRYDGVTKANPLISAERASRDAYIRALRALNLPEQ